MEWKEDFHVTCSSLESSLSWWWCIRFEGTILAHNELAERFQKVNARWKSLPRFKTPLWANLSTQMENSWYIGTVRWPVFIVHTFVCFITIARFSSGNSASYTSWVVDARGYKCNGKQLFARIFLINEKRKHGQQTSGVTRVLNK